MDQADDGGFRATVGVAAQARPRSRGFAIEPRSRRASPLRASIADAEHECHRARARQAKPRIDRAARGPALDPPCARWPVRWRRDAERPLMMFDLALLGRRSNTEQPGARREQRERPVRPRTKSCRLRLGVHRRQSSASPRRCSPRAVSRRGRVAVHAVGAWRLRSRA